MNEPTGPRSQPGARRPAAGDDAGRTGPLHQPGAPLPDEPTGPLSQPAAPATGASAADAAGTSEAGPAAGRHDDAGRLGEGARTDVFEVFRQEKDGDPMRHAGNVVAPDVELATHYAREMYGRRQESVRLWIVPRAQVTDLSDPDLLQPPLDRTFKKPGGYVMRDKLEIARRRAAKQAEERP